jgi:hypothetical protein
MVNQLIYLSLLLIISNAYSIQLNSKPQINSNSNIGCTISLKKNKNYDRVAAISFISDIQSSIGKFKNCIIYIFKKKINFNL